jgi:hypothetical protein
MHARYYSPFLARFVSVDPVQGTVGGSQGWNRYSYVLNNPVKLVDPDGAETRVFLYQGSSVFDLPHAFMSVSAGNGEVVASYAGDFPGHDLSLGDGSLGYRAALMYVLVYGGTVSEFTLNLSSNEEQVLFDVLTGDGLRLNEYRPFDEDMSKGLFPCALGVRDALFEATEMNLDRNGMLPGDLANDLDASPRATVSGEYSLDWGSVKKLLMKIQGSKGSSTIRAVNSEVVYIDGKLQFIGH